MLKQSSPTQLLIGLKNSEVNLQRLKSFFPQRRICPTFFDNARRAIIIVNAASADDINRALSLLRGKRYISPSPQYFPVR